MRKLGTVTCSSGFRNRLGFCRAMEWDLIESKCIPNYKLQDKVRTVPTGICKRRGERERARAMDFETAMSWLQL